MSEFGLKIRNIKAATLFGYNQGYRDRYDYTEAMFSNSLFYDFIIKNGLSVWNNESTRDIICLDFGFGVRSYEEEIDHLNKQFGDLDGEKYSEADRKRIQAVFDNVEAHKDKYVHMSRDELREHYYEHGVSITYHNKGTKGRPEQTQTIHYKMLERNASKAKIGQVMFINADLYEVAYDWLTMGLGHKMPMDNAKIVEMSAYAPLSTSSIVGKMRIPVEDILILRDQKSTYTAPVKAVRSAPYVKPVRVLDEVRTAQSKEKALKKRQFLEDGTLKYRKYYKTVEQNENMCVVEDTETEVTNTLWDGMALIEDALLPPGINGMALLRNHFFKACAFRTKLQDFFKDWCKFRGYDYDSSEVTDMFGRPHLLKDIKMVTTENAIKWLKFVNLMGGTPESAFDYWCQRVNADGSVFGIVKTDHPSKLNDVQQMSYQMINTLPCSKQEIFDLASTSIKQVEEMKQDDEVFVAYLKKNKNDINHFEMLADLYEYNPEIAQTQWFRYEKAQIIRDYVNRLKTGKIVLNADNLTICGNPFALLLYSVGEDWSKDPALNYEEGVIQCYTTRFKDGAYLCGIRNPHNSPNNICYLHNHYSEYMDRYFVFSPNILALNCIHTDVQDRANGCDFDSDFFFTTDNTIMVRSAAKAYRDFPTIVNQLKESGLKYKNIMSEYARMDSKFAKGRIGIGESSNLAQLALTYYWTEPSRELYDNFVILSVIAQVIIDGCKREYEVDGVEEIKRIKKLPCMHRYVEVTDKNGNIKKQKKDFPEFMRHTRKPKHTKDGKEIPQEEYKLSKDKLEARIDGDLCCPMNVLQEALKTIKWGSKAPCMPIEGIFVKYSGNKEPNRRQMKRIKQYVNEYVDGVQEIMDSDDDRELKYQEVRDITDVTIAKIRKIKIQNPATINRLIELALKLDSGIGPHTQNRSAYAKCARNILKMLHKANKELFLSNFAPKCERKCTNNDEEDV